MRRRWMVEPATGRLLSGVLGIGLALLVTALLTARLRPFLLRLAQEDIRNTLTLAVMQAAEEGTADPANLSRVVAETLEAVRRRDAAVPIGSLSNLPLLYGRGPCLRVRVLSAEAVVLDSDRFTVDLTLFLPWTWEQTTLYIQIPPSAGQNVMEAAHEGTD